MICCCSLAGTRACLTCSNYYSNFYDQNLYRWNGGDYIEYTDRIPIPEKLKINVTSPDIDELKREIEKLKAEVEKLSNEKEREQ